MSFTRFHYDRARTSKSLQESTDPGRWIFSTPSTGESFSVDPQLRIGKWGGNLCYNPVDIASDLDGRNTIISTYGNVRNVKEQPVVGTNEDMPYIDESRATHPAFMYRDLPHVRWEYPLLHPQEHLDFQIGNKNVSSRIIQKNNFVPKYNR